MGMRLCALQNRIRAQIQDPTIMDYSAAVQMERKIDHSDRPSSFSSHPNSTARYSPRPSYTQRSASGVPALASQPHQLQSPISTTTSSTESCNPRRFCRMKDEEYLKHRNAGTCFKCGLKFGPTHRCPPKTLHVLVGCHDIDSMDEEVLGDWQPD